MEIIDIGLNGVIILTAIGYTMLGYAIGKGMISWKKKEVIKN